MGSKSPASSRCSPKPMAVAQYDAVGRGRGRSARSLVLVLVGAVVVAAGGAAVGSRFATPAQRAADARPPVPSLITMPLKRGVLNARIVFRATLQDSGSFAIPALGPEDGSLPIVTALDVAQGTTVTAGQVIAAVAGRPVVILPGRIPAFRAMSEGVSGVDVGELQDALDQLGFGIGSDAAGVYGVGTATAVRALFLRIGYPPITAPAIGGASTSPQPRGGRPKPLPQLATVPLGEIAFVPSLPARVASVQVRLGGRATGTLATAGSGMLTMRTSIPWGEAANLRSGQLGWARSDLDGRRIRVRIVHVTPPTGSASTAGGSVPSAHVQLQPVGPVPSALDGQNLGVTIQTARTRRRTWIVPVAAIVTTAAGQSFIGIADAGGRTRQVQVMPGLVSGGQEAVSTARGGLAVGEQVVIGTGGGS